MTPRVAFFTDSFHEVNGVALTSRVLDSYARRRGYPFLTVCTGAGGSSVLAGVYERHELPLSHYRLGLEHDLAFDLTFWRHRNRIKQAVGSFNADLVHVTGPGHAGMLGAMVAHSLGLPLVASWHTNVHEFGARRLRQLLSWTPDRVRSAAVEFSERKSLELTLLFYKLARILFAPNPELRAMLETRTERPTHLMERGIDCNEFHPRHRTRDDHHFVVGYVGRLSPEKNVRMLVWLDQALTRAGVTNRRFLIVGDGGEREWLRQELPSADLPGTLQGPRLTEAYANMDAFVFPSETDTFGNVVLEAMASGVVPIVSDKGGPKFLVRHDVTGVVAKSPEEFAKGVVRLWKDRAARERMRTAARRAAEGRRWEAVMEGVFERYREAIASGLLVKRSELQPEELKRPQVLRANSPS